jgi:hypothetical protein
MRSDYNFMVIKICTLLGYYAAASDNPLPTFRGQRVGAIKMGPTRCPEMALKYYHLTLRNFPEECRCHQCDGGSLKSRIRGNYLYGIRASKSQLFIAS